MLAWPTTIPSHLNQDGFSYEVGDTLLRSENQNGPAKVRRIVTKSTDAMSGNLTLTKAQVAGLMYFYDTTTNGGALPFEFPNPLTDSVSRVRFTQAPSFSYLGVDHYRASVRFEVLPS